MPLGLGCVRLFDHVFDASTARRGRCRHCSCHRGSRGSRFAWWQEPRREWHAAREMKSVLRAVPAAPDLPVHTRALDIASWALAILATQNAIASVAFREMSETLGSTQVRNGIVPDPDGCFRECPGSSVTPKRLHREMCFFQEGLQLNPSISVSRPVAGASSIASRARRGVPWRKTPDTGESSPVRAPSLPCMQSPRRSTHVAESYCTGDG